ncbi:hypothetical protein LY76DRAFT_523664, partial [Colletotrichum caudatum]
VSLTLRCKFRFVIRRTKKDGTDSPCMMRWSPSLEAPNPSSLFLLRHIINHDNGTELVDIDRDGGKRAAEEEGLVLRTASLTFALLLPPGGVARLTALLPEGEYCAPQAGDRYTLLCPRAQVAAWQRSPV